MKLIDVLVMISKGELKEGTKVIYKGEDDEIEEYIYTRNNEKEEESLDLYYCDEEGCLNNKGMPITLLGEYCLSILNDEIKLIESDHFTDVGKMATKK